MNIVGLPPGLVSDSARRTNRRERAAVRAACETLEHRVAVLEKHLDVRRGSKLGSTLLHGNSSSESSHAEPESETSRSAELFDIFDVNESVGTQTCASLQEFPPGVACTCATGQLDAGCQTVDRTSGFKVLTGIDNLVNEVVQECCKSLLHQVQESLDRIAAIIPTNAEELIHEMKFALDEYGNDDSPMTCDTSMEFLNCWRQSYAHFWSPVDVIALDKDRLEFRDEAIDSACLRSSEITLLRIIVDEIPKAVITYADVELHHVKSRLQHAINIPFTELSVGSMLYDWNLRGTELMMTVADATKFEITFASLSEDPLLQDMRDARANLLGHLFTYDRPLFWKQLGQIDIALKKRIVAFGIQHLMASPAVVYTCPELERMFHDGSEDACKWQYEYKDEDEESELLTLLKLLRQATDKLQYHEL